MLTCRRGRVTLPESLVVVAVRSGRLLAAPTTGNGSECARRGGYQPPEQACDFRRAPAERGRAAFAGHGIKNRPGRGGWRVEKCFATLRIDHWIWAWLLMWSMQ